ncbi:hypothetical protein BUALT_Bualt02G0129300 [Buddleja alternifolia]|uniref:NADH dehydrogenase subunit 6 n=1 Tax=Buddleja alternifolia TaxID=168488 RepID=A0AAV6Y8D1_9LAMI|nr:hypothetical protein BUALT_Bualt02G0129300 [Buddleja alternifolia]
MVVVGAVMGMMSGTLVYYHCAYRHSSAVSLFADVFIVLLCSLAILGLLFRHMNIAVPVVSFLYVLSVIGRAVSGVTVAYIGLCFFSLYIVVANSQTNSTCLAKFSGRKDAVNSAQDGT